MTLAVTVLAVVNVKELKKKFPLKCVKYHDCLIMKLSKVTQYRVMLKLRSHCCVLTFLSYRLHVCNGNEIYIRKKSLLSSPDSMVKGQSVKIKFGRKAIELRKKIKETNTRLGSFIKINS